MDKTKISRILASLFALSLIIFTIACDSENEDENDDSDKGIVSTPYDPNEKGFKPADKEEYYEQVHVMMGYEGDTKFSFPHTRIAFKQTYNGEGIRYVTSNIALGIKTPSFSDIYKVSGSLKDLPFDSDTWEAQRSLPYYDAKDDREVRSLNIETEKETGLETAIVRTYKTDISLKTNDPYCSTTFTISIEMPISTKTPSGNIIKIPIDENKIFADNVSIAFDDAIYEYDNASNPYVQFTYRIGVFTLDESWVYAKFIKRFVPEE